MTRTIRSVHVTIPTENGWQLAGTVDMPRDVQLEDAPRRAVVAHCFTCTRGAIGVTVSYTHLTLPTILRV